MDSFTSPFKNGRFVNMVFLSNILLSFHYYLIVYINSSFLNNFFSESQISTLYIIGAILNIILFLKAAQVLNTLSNYRATLYAIVFEALATFGLAISRTPFLLGVYFIIHTVTVAFLSFNLDIFLESATTNEEQTGSVRSMFNTLANITLILSQVFIAAILVHNSFWRIYILSFLFLIPMFYYVKKYLQTNKEKTIDHIQVRETIKKYAADKNLYNIFSSQLLLQLFYAFMVVYTPLYLEKYIGFSWSEIGIIFMIMLLPFVIFEIPVGNLADKKYGEKEFLTVGFIVMGLATLFISFVTVKSIWFWAIILFVTRIGASFVEITCDTYFFKKVDQDKTDLVSFYRMTRPLSYVIAPIIATLSLQFIPFEYTFLIIGSLMIVGTHYSLALEDTR